MASERTGKRQQTCNMYLPIAAAATFDDDDDDDDDGGGGGGGGSNGVMSLMLPGIMMKSTYKNCRKTQLR